MKNLNKTLIAFIAIVVASCTTDAVDNRTVIESISPPEVITPENNMEYILTEENAANVADIFTWTKAKYSNDVVVQYTVLMDIKGGDFTNAQTVGTTSDVNQLSVLVKNLNGVAIELGAVTGEASLFDIKVKSSVSGVLFMVSETPITISITTYTGALAYEFTDWYLIGGAVAGGWDENSTIHQPLFRSATDANEYKFTGYFMVGEFKFISTLGSWLPQLGKGADDTSITIKTIDAQSDPGTFNIAVAGYYTFTMNTETLTASLVAYDVSAAVTYATVGVIGSSTPLGWEGSTAMTKSSFNAHVWSLGVISLEDGEAKFRANNDWTPGWGDNTAFSGVGSTDASSPNIPVAKSKYKIFFNDLDGSYLMIPNQE